MKQTALRDRIAEQIFFIRGQKVLLDADLAKLYGVTTFDFNKAVRRNIDRCLKRPACHSRKKSLTAAAKASGLSWWTMCPASSITIRS